MELRCDPSGMVTVVAGTFSHGQGHATVYAQMVSEWLGVPFENIRFVQGDTDQVPFGRGTYASRSSMVGGNALRAATDVLIDKARPLAAHLMEAARADVVFDAGSFRVVGTDRAIPFAGVARAFYLRGGIPKEFGAGLEASASWGSDPPNFPNACHVCEVEIDGETGAVAIDRYTIVDDVGRAINPLICEGQIHGGLAQGIGQALLEQVAYDRESGQLLSGTFTEYCMPRAGDFPALTVALAEIPCRTNPIGVKGVATAAALVRGLSDAQLDRSGTVLTGMPPMSAEQITSGILINHIEEHLTSIRATVGAAKAMHA
jgi:carbon-monoxide dehydrogenase large subunit